MEKIALLTGMRGESCDVNVDMYPDICPICHRSIHAEFVAGICQGSRMRKPQAAFRCSHPDCGRLFISNYKYDGPLPLKLGTSEPMYPEKASFPQPIESISPMFVKIYNQAIEAETLNLDQLSGIGFRKALEFLVKDFCLVEHPDKSEEIKSSSLLQCVKKYINSEQIKKCAKTADWLCNNRNHYLHKWQEKDITDLKLLIKLTVNWIENYLLIEEHKEEALADVKK